MRAVACLGLLALTLPLPAADAKFDPAGRARALAPLIEEETFALVRIDFTRTDLDGLARTLPPLAPSGKGELAELVRRLKAFQTAFTRAGGTELVVALSTEDLPGISLVYVPLKASADVPALTGLLKRRLPEGTVLEKRGSALVAGPRAALARLARGKPSARAELSAAVSAAGDTAVQVLLLVTADQRRVIDEVVTLPGAPGKVLTRAVRWAALGLDVGTKPRAELTVQSADATGARQLAGLIATGLALLGKMTFLGEDRPLKDLPGSDFTTASGALKPTVTGSRVTLQVSAPDAVRALTALGEAVVGRTRGVERSRSDLKEILLALHGYNGATGTFPPHAIYGKDGKALLSWRVAILPYLGEEALYKQFKLDEPWDSPHNKKLIARMPRVYRSPRIRDRRPGLTTYLAPINKEFVFTGTKEGVRLPRDIPDGTSRTAVVVDVNDETGVLWTKPADLVVDQKDPWKGLLGHYPAFVLAGLADGTVRRVPKTVPASTIWALFTRAGGEVFPDLPR
jgi:hypothetical protein